MFTSNLKSVVSGRKKRVGRGPGSGKGFHTVGKGQKGQTSRGGYHIKKGFEGGAVSLSKRLPQVKGFKPLKSSKVVAINITKLLDKGIFEIDATALFTYAENTNVKLVGAADYGSYDLKKVVLKKDVPATGSLRAKVAASGGSVEDFAAE
jgi:large subunit ribosomal protein L15